MLILVLVLIKSVFSQVQELCYEGPGDVYSGFINVTGRGDPCEDWDSQTLINIRSDSAIGHNYCRVFLQMSSKPYCVYRGQKQSCDIPECDSSTLLFDGASLLLSRSNVSLPYFPIVVQQINFYFKVDTIQRSQAVLVRVQSVNDPKQHFSVVLQNGFLKLIVSLDSYNAEKYVFGGPISTGDVHYVSVNRSRALVYVRLNDTITNQTLINKDTTFLVAPYTIAIGENFFGCMTGLSVGTWIQRRKKMQMYSDKPFTFYTGKDIDEFSIARTRMDSPRSEMCMYAPTTSVVDFAKEEIIIENNSVEEAAVGTDIVAKGGRLDTTSIIIISSSLGVILVLTAITLVCMKRNQNSYTPQGYNLEVM